MNSITNLRCDLEYQIYADTHFCFNIQASRRDDQRILQESLVVTPGMEVREFEDPNNGNRFFRCDGTFGILNVRYDAQVELRRLPPDESAQESPITELPNEVLHYLLPTRYCQSDMMSRAAQHLFGRVPPGYRRVRHICDWIRENIAYQIGVSTPTTSAQDVYLQRAGVCRDFSHLAITFCRALNIPARLVVGYVRFVEPPQDFHATFEAWLGNRWVMFDPTELAPVEAMVRVGNGRDAKDAAFATMYGMVAMSYMHLQIHHDGSPTSDTPDPRGATVRRLMPA